MTLKLRLSAFRRHKSKSSHGRKVGVKSPAAATMAADAPVYTDASFGSLSFAPSRDKRTSLCPEKLPTLGYTDDADFYDCEHAPSSFAETPRSTPSLTSSTSYASSLTLSEVVVDDGLTAWGLPKVIGVDVDADEDEFYDCEDFAPREVKASQVEVKAQAPVAQPSKATPTAQQLLAKKTLAVVYTALLTRNNAPSRYSLQPQPAATPVWSMFI